MHRTVSLGRCFMAVALATILLTSPTAGFAQLGGLLPSPPAATSSTVVGDASAARVSVLGILGTAMTTALADTGTLTTANNALDASMLAGGIPSALSAETLSASTISWADQVDSEASLGNNSDRRDWGPEPSGLDSRRPGHSQRADDFIHRRRRSECSACRCYRRCRRRSRVRDCGCFLASR